MVSSLITSTYATAKIMRARIAAQCVSNSAGIPGVAAMAGEAVHRRMAAPRQTVRKFRFMDTPGLDF
jgi:hypothetical protein